VRESGARFLLQGTILTDVDETIAESSGQHNVFEQLGIDPQEAFGYRILEPLIQLRKDGVRKAAGPWAFRRRPSSASPFPGPRSPRASSQATPERIETVRKATVVVEKILGGTKGVPVHGNPPRGPRHWDADGSGTSGCRSEVRCWRRSMRARRRRPVSSSTSSKASPGDHPQGARRRQRHVQRRPKPPSTIEAV